MKRTMGFPRLRATQPAPVLDAAEMQSPAPVAEETFTPEPDEDDDRPILAAPIPPPPRHEPVLFHQPGQPPLRPTPTPPPRAPWGLGLQQSKVPPPLPVLPPGWKPPPPPPFNELERAAAMRAKRTAEAPAPRPGGFPLARRPASVLSTATGERVAVPAAKPTPPETVRPKAPTGPAPKIPPKKITADDIPF